MDSILQVAGIEAEKINSVRSILSLAVKVKKKISEMKKINIFFKYPWSHVINKLERDVSLSNDILKSLELYFFTISSLRKIFFFPSIF